MPTSPRPTMHPLPPKLRKKKDPEKLPHKINCSPFKEATQEQRKKCGYYRQDLGTYQTKYSVGINDCMHKQFELLFLHFLGNQTAKLYASWSSRTNYNKQNSKKQRIQDEPGRGYRWSCHSCRWQWRGFWTFFLEWRSSSWIGRWRPSMKLLGRTHFALSEGRPVGRTHSGVGGELGEGFGGFWEKMRALIEPDKLEIAKKQPLSLKSPSLPLSLSLFRCVSLSFLFVRRFWEEGQRRYKYRQARWSVERVYLDPDLMSYDANWIFVFWVTSPTGFQLHYFVQVQNF